jgi:hypothetical protein
MSRLLLLVVSCRLFIRSMTLGRLRQLKTLTSSMWLLQAAVAVRVVTATALAAVVLADTGHRLLVKRLVAVHLLKRNFLLLLVPRTR